jgi:hypothetical protein
MAAPRAIADEAAVFPDTLTGFDEDWYVQSYYDVAHGIKAGRWASGLEHYRRYGHREFRLINAKQAKRMVPTKCPGPAAEVAPEYRAMLRWQGPAQLASDTISVDFEVENTGLAPWPKAQEDAAGVLIYAGARLYQGLDQVGMAPASREYRLKLPGTVRPGDSARFTLQLDREALPVGRSFLLIDMVWEHRFWFSEKSTVPLVLGMNREEGADDIELVTSETPVRHDSKAEARVDSPQKNLRGWQRLRHPVLLPHALMQRLSRLPTAVKRWRHGPSTPFSGRA